MRRRLSKSLILSAAFFFAFAQVFSSTHAFAQTTILSGKIIKIAAAGDQLEITLQTEKGTVKLLADRSTLIQQTVPAKTVRTGQKVFIFPKGKGKKAKRARSSLKNIPPEVRKALGIPDLPEIQQPEIPTLPQVPTAPAKPVIPIQPPKIAKPPEAPKIPPKPVMPPQAPGRVPVQAPLATDKPTIAKPSTPADAAQPPERQGGAEGEAMMPQGAPSSDAEAKRKSEVPDAVEPPKGARSSSIKPSALKKATPSVKSFPVKKVIQTKEMPQGVELQLESKAGKKETVMLPADEKVIALFTLKDLKKEMTVKVEVAEEAGAQFAQRITIA